MSHCDHARLNAYPERQEFYVIVSPQSRLWRTAQYSVLLSRQLNKKMKYLTAEQQFHFSLTGLACCRKIFDQRLRGLYRHSESNHTRMKEEKIWHQYKTWISSIASMSYSEPTRQNRGGNVPRAAPDFGMSLVPYFSETTRMRKCFCDVLLLQGKWVLAKSRGRP